MTGTDIKIGLLWHSPNSGNLGVGALTLANMAIVRGVAAELGLNPRFTIIGMQDGTAPYVSPADAELCGVTSRSMIDPRGCWATIRAQDCILDIGGGDSFTDIYSNKRYLFIWATKAMAIVARRPLMLCPQTIGPFSRQPHSAMAAYALRHADVVIARDEASVGATHRLAPDANCIMTTDVAFALPYVSQSHLRGGPRPRVGVNVSGLLFNEAVQGRNRFGLDVNYAEFTRGLLAWLNEVGADVHLFTHVVTPAPEDDDSQATDLIAREFPWATRVPNFPGPSEAKGFISGLDFVVSGRMHACIGAVSSGTPVVPIAYSRKFRGVFGLVHYPWFVDTEGKTTADALAFVQDCFAKRETLAKDCVAGLSRAAPYLDVYRQELRRFLGSAARR